mgnify:CR=1 FL=1
MSSLFNKCYELEEVNFGNSKTKNLKFMNEMFRDCKELKYLDLIKFYLEIKSK